jgi:phosphomannomutase
VYTALHGVGDALLQRVLREAGFTHVASVPEQAEPDGAFPTVAFPNPEEPGAMDMVTALAIEQDAALVLANDPDADRLAACVRLAPGSYRQLSGNQVGVLLGHYLIERDLASRDPDAGRALVITTLVSSPWMGRIAQALGASYDETLTGFKWIANRAMERHEEHGERFLFGYEEALGYSVGTIVRDKDGIGAALVLAVLAAELHAKGQTLLDELEGIAQRHGYYASRQRSVRFDGSDGPQRMAAVMQSLRDDPPRAIAGLAVEAVVDCQLGTRTVAGESEPITLPKSNVISFFLTGGHRVTARPSGTEPKMKLYTDVCQPLTPSQTMDDAEQRARATIATLEEAMITRLGLAG